MHHKNWHGDFLQILSEVGLREGDDTIVVSLCPAHHALPPPVLNGRLGRLARLVVVIEGTRSEVAVELRAVGRKLRLQIVEYLLGQSLWIGRRLNHQGRHRADDGCLGYATLAM